MNLSFAGCGFLGIYHVGVAVCFKNYAPHLLLEKIGGASAGSLAACCLLCDLPLGSMTSDFFRVVNEARRHSLGPFSPSFNIQTCLLEGLQKHLPEDAHKRVNGRLHISLTSVFDGQNVIISEFESREEVLQALLCACFIPGFSGILPPRFRGVRYMDGAFSNNLPILDENTITVSPFCGESDICPRDQSSQLFHFNWANTSIEISRQNVNRFVRILFPPRPEFLSKFCQQGFDDALQFLHRNNLINCRRCVAVQSTFVVSETVAQPPEFDPECRECKRHRKDALSSNMPQTVLDVIQDYIEQANKGLANWIFKHRGIKLLSLPATVPMDFLLATVYKISSLTPKLTKQMRQLANQLNNAIQMRLFSKFTLYDQPHFDTTGLLHSSRLYGPRVSILVDECGASPLNVDVDNFEHVLKMSTHNDALYAYYYTDNSTNHVKVTEIFDFDEMTEHGELATNLQLYEGSVEDHPNPRQPHSHNAVVSEWNGVESDFFIDAQSPNSTELPMQGMAQLSFFSTVNIEHNTTGFNEPQAEANSNTSNDLCIEIE
ncbi:1-acylglycerol-3-phosphate O-acyltransferase Pnpla3-like isoform X1 [Drosophila sulfurigaster albostrigata]|uniref:1-acylglycerol-3-phosphate O-acyltransferase Pnpla3-like isoform X1 n=1 Tax=Drosophila sulfurigaster albostrigata TaxID=89887 RepID=UPI002D21E38A|nr:1-acylglycerol-3-phosphate O-acyltransferase Pnpla3-like isoform X1 [Drosophila sulfurigaster albostrigata]